MALGLSMDNLAVALASGTGMHRALSFRKILFISALFAIAHVVMFSAGWWGGAELGRIIHHFDHWISFTLLGWVGGKMVWESHSSAEHIPGVNLTGFECIGLALATSIDALGVGVASAFGQISYVSTLIALSVCVFLTSIFGFLMGALLGRQFEKYMEAFGGVVLIGLGIKILLSGLGIW